MTPSRSFRPGLGFGVALGLAVLVVVLALAAAVSGALGARGASSILGGTALVLVGLGLLAVLRVPARSLVVNAPRLRLERNRARAARERSRQREADGLHGSRGRADRRRGLRDDSPEGALVPMVVPGTDVVIPESTGRRELTTLDVVSGPVTTALAATRVGRAADERLAGTTTGETLVRVGQLLAGALGFILLALGLASILGQVLS
ncbi:hypothetical protein D4740_07470 [Actinomyces sp. 2119]|uniref:hypothetical protein n=1 Tax=Actinomyces sp. 2119 TaxID=2321393 RepID=UPI000E6B531D|nr:hypothetical protein [Actinomyces sp. 2119]RJF41902.1 hypothetical protein D4740_07470 [Actinomyces sp. 2119]